MKFTGFNLMPWPHLPDDFREQHRSVSPCSSRCHTLLPNATLGWVEGAGQMAPYEQPNDVAEAITKFLAG